MTNKKEGEKTFEEKLRFLGIYWFSITIVILLTFTVFYANSISPLILDKLSTQPTTNVNTNSTSTSITANYQGTISNQVSTNSTQIYSTNLVINNTIDSIIYMSLLLTFIGGSILLKNRQKESIFKELFDELSIIKTNLSTGIIKLEDEKELLIDWSNRGYFILMYKEEKLAVAKSTELYWKILYSRHILFSKQQP